jgi:hypothetical protein
LLINFSKAFLLRDITYGENRQASELLPTISSLVKMVIIEVGNCASEGEKETGRVLY